MAFNTTNTPPGRPGQAGPPAGWQALRDQRAAELLNKTKGRKRLFIMLSVVLLILLVFAGIRFSSIVSGTDEQLVIHVANEQPATVDLRQIFLVNADQNLVRQSNILPQIGANVFPKTGSNSENRAFSGFMSYDTTISTGLRDMHVNFLRYPGGDWGSKNILSLDQLDDFSDLLTKTNAQGMIQAYLGGPLPNADAQGHPPVPSGMGTDIQSRAQFAGNWVDYMNNPASDLRRSRPNKLTNQVKLWTVGNEPDLPAINDPTTNQPFTVAGYTAAFIQYSIKMHQSNPQISVFGPEISRFYGIGAGPRDATGALWMEQFLQGVADYEKAHYTDDAQDKDPTKIHFHILDGVSFHYYPFASTTPPVDQLLSNADSWNYLLPALRNEIRSVFRRDMPIALTEINTNSSGQQQPTAGQAALWWADTLGSLLNQQVNYIGFFGTQGINLTTPYPLFLNGHETAMARVMEIYSHVQSHVVPLSIQHDPLSVYATVDGAQRQNVSLVLVNKSPDPQNVQINPSATALALASPWHSQSVIVGGDSIVLLTLHRNGGAEAFSFTVPAVNDPNNANVGSVNYVVCGQSTTTDTNTPC